MVVGAIAAGVVMRPLFKKEEQKGELLSKETQTLSYGFFGVIFFFWVGFNADIAGFLQEPLLGIIIILFFSGHIRKTTRSIFNASDEENKL